MAAWDCAEAETPGQASGRRADKGAVTELMARAAELLETAQACSAAGSEGEWTLLQGQEGGWQLVAGADHEPRALAAARGAQAVLRVLRHGGAVRVEAWDSSGRCVVESRSTGQRMERLVPDQRLYAAAGLAG